MNETKKPPRSFSCDELLEFLNELAKTNKLSPIFEACTDFRTEHYEEVQLINTIKRAQYQLEKLRQEQKGNRG